jgi:outer membrane protein TolC
MPDFLSPVIEGVLLQKKLITEDQMTPMSDAKIPLQFGTKHNMSASITASQLLFDGSYIVGLQAAKTFVDLSARSLAKSEIEVREAVAQAYFLVLVAEENKKILDSTLATINKTFYESKEAYNAGFIEDTDVDQVHLLASSLENKVNMVSRQVEIVYNLLKFQLGIDIAVQISLSDNLIDIVNMTLSKNLTSQQFDVNNHIDFKLLLASKQLSLLNLKRDRFGYLPSLNAFFSTSGNAMRSDFDFISGKDPWFKTTVFGINLNLPIWDSGIKHFKIQQDKLELKKTDVRIKQAEQGLRLDVENNKSSVKTFSDQYITELKNMELAKKIYYKTLVKYKEGVSASMDLTTAQNQYLSTQGNYFNTILQLLNANSNLNKALGN